VRQVVQGALEALGPKCLTVNHLRHYTWCGVARTLCAGDVETPFLVAKALYLMRHQGDQGSLVSDFMVSLCGSQVVLLGETW
jgi:hypothetical protein